MIEKSPPKTVLSASLDTNPAAIPIDNNIQTGDTPTIYASLDNADSEKSPEDQKDSGGGEDDEPLTIFGIPIPKIPFPILSFGLAPTTLR